MPPEIRKHKIRNMLAELPNLLPPGLTAIKQCELYNEWRKIVPDEFKDITCPRPSDEVLNKVRKERNEKATRKNKKKKVRKE